MRDYSFKMNNRPGAPSFSPKQVAFHLSFLFIITTCNSPIFCYNYKCQEGEPRVEKHRQGSKKNKKNLQNPLDKPLKMWYNKSVKREIQPKKTNDRVGVSCGV